VSDISLICHYLLTYGISTRIAVLKERSTPSYDDEQALATMTSLYDETLVILVERAWSVMTGARSN
jgi:hypothetical protein